MEKAIAAFAFIAGILPSTAVCAQTVSEPTSDIPKAGESDIVVTAQKRSERVTDVPISITVLSADTLRAAGVRSLTDLTAVTPGLYFAQNGAYAQPVVRGVSASVTAAGADANVATYVDGVYQPNQQGNFTDLVDIERVEVLKGPQGTLFGRNATGGAISVTTKSPSYDPAAEFSASYGRFDDIRLTAYGSAGLSDDVAMSLSFLYGSNDGYTRNLGTGNRVSKARSLALRGKLLFEPTDDLKVVLTLAHSKKDDNGAFSLSPYNGNNNSLALPGVKVPTPPREVSLSFDPSITSRSDSVALRGEFDLGFATLASITAYQSRINFANVDGDRTNLSLSRSDINETDKTFSQEFNIVSTGTGPVKWFAGFFYYNDVAHYNLTLNLTSTAFTRVKSQAWAPFAEVNWEILPHLTVIGGIRYNSETKTYNGSYNPFSVLAKKTFTNATPRVGLRYAIDSGSNVYATWSRGFKSGLFDTGSIIGAATSTAAANSTKVVQPEEIDAFEGGYKFGRGSTNLSIAGYYYNYRNLQFQALNPSGSGNLVFNAASAEIYGAEAAFAFRPVQGLKVQGGFAYTHARYTDFPRALIYQPLPGGGNILVGLGATNPVTGAVNLNGASGNKISRMPEFTGSLISTYETGLANGSRLELSSSGYYSGAFFWTPQNRLRQGGYLLLNGEIAWISPDKRLRLSIWGKNLTDRTYGIYVVDSARGDSAAYGRPRTFGVAATISF